MKIFRIWLLVLAILACEDAPESVPSSVADNKPFVKAVDISQYPHIERAGVPFYDAGGTPADFMEILKMSGINTIRLKVWVDPIDQTASIGVVSHFARQLREYGFDIWLTLHFSDTWADPGQQRKPMDWQSTPFAALRDSVKSHTAQVMDAIGPEIIQIGNEINHGFLHPDGRLSDHKAQMITLLTDAIRTVRSHSASTKVMLHFAGWQGADWFFGQMDGLDYDQIGLSFYPRWHGKDLGQLQQTIQQLGEKYRKGVLVAETAYPFTLGWNDWTHNIVGLESQLILPAFPATPLGQAAYLQKLKEVVQSTESGVGIGYWGAELVAWQGEQAQNGSPWENQALFDFGNKALPALQVLGE